MRRLFTILLTLCLITALCLPLSFVQTRAETGNAADGSSSESSDGSYDFSNDKESDEAGTGTGTGTGTGESGSYDFSKDQQQGVTDSDSSDTDNSDADSSDTDSSNANSSDEDGSDTDDSGKDSSSASDDSSQQAADTGNSNTNGVEDDKASAVNDDSAYYKIAGFPEAKNISADSAILMDAASSAILYQKDMDKKQYPASITKIMTALLAIEKCKMDDIVTFSDQAVNGIEEGSSTAGINVGAELTVEDTLYALMLVSANEAGAALAEHIAGSDESFAELMNVRAAELGCTGTHFTNPHGLPDEDHYTTARDMALIVKEAMTHEEFRTISGTLNYTLKKSDTLNNDLDLWNHSKILMKSSEYYYENAEGSKTGYTMAADHTLATFAKQDNVELICVVLKEDKSMDYLDTAALFKWGFDKVDGITPFADVDLNSVISSSKKTDDSLKKSLKSLKPSFDKDYYVLVQKGFDESGLKIAFKEDQDRKAKRIGYLTASDGGKVIAKAPVTYKGKAVTDATKPVDGNEDGLETAPKSRKGFSIGGFFKLLLKIAFVGFLIFAIVRFVLPLLPIKKAAQSSRTGSSRSGSTRSESARSGRAGAAGSKSGSAGAAGSKSGSGSGRNGSSGSKGSTSRDSSAEPNPLSAGSASKPASSSETGSSADSSSSRTSSGRRRRSSSSSGSKSPKHDRR